MILKHTKYTALALALILISPSLSDAKGGRGGSGFSGSRSSSSYSKPSSSYSKPSSLPGAARPATVNTGGSQNRNITKPAPARPPATNTYSRPAVPATTNNSTNSYSRPSSNNTVTRSPASMPPNAVGALGSAANATMSRDSLSAYYAERNRFNRPPTNFNKDAVKTDPLVQSTRRQYPRIDDYMQNRTRQMQTYNNRYPETQRYNQTMSPNYGMFDSNFLMGMLLGHWTSNSNNNNNSSAAWLSSQRDQEWYKTWRADLEKAAKENSELRAKIEEMDRQIAELKPSDKPASVLPEGVPASLAVAPEAVIVDAYEDHSFPWGWSLFMAFLGLAGLVAFYFYQVGSRPQRRRYA